MKPLSKEQYEKAKIFIKTRARKFEKRLFEYEFEAGPIEDVLVELDHYQNKDGGFGNGLEPDLRLSASSVLATTVALQNLSRLKVSRNHETIVNAMNYLVQTYNEENSGWEIIPREADTAPRAIWWNYCGYSAKWGNPNAEILGYFYEYAELVPSHLLDHLTKRAFDYLNVECNELEMHEMYCYIRLADRLPKNVYDLISEKLEIFVENCVVKNPEARNGYCATPLQIVDSPQSLFYNHYVDVIPSDLDGLISEQSEDGAWAPNWSWGRYEDEWEVAKEEWKGIITLNTMRTLQAFNRFA